MSAGERSTTTRVFGRVLGERGQRRGRLRG